MNKRNSNLSQKLEIIKSIFNLCEKNSEKISLHINSLNELTKFICLEIQKYIESTLPEYNNFLKDYANEKHECNRELKYFDNFSINKILGEESVLEDKADLYIKTSLSKIKEYEAKETKLYNGILDCLCKMYNYINLNEQVTRTTILEKCGNKIENKLKHSFTSTKRNAFDLFPHVRFAKDSSIVMARDKYVPQMCSSYSPLRINNKNYKNDLPSLISTQYNIKKSSMKEMNKSKSSGSIKYESTYTQNSINYFPNLHHHLSIKDLEDKTSKVKINDGYEKKLRFKINRVISMHFHSRKIYNLTENYYNDDCSRFVKLVISLDKQQNFLVEDKILPLFNKYMCLFIRNKVTDEEYSLVIGGDIKINTYEFIYQMEKLLTSSKLNCLIKFELTLYSFFSECIVDFHHKGHFDIKTNIKDNELEIYFKETESIEKEREKLFKSI